MKYCCAYAYRCPARDDVVTCYVHGGSDPCCSDERAHECLEDMYGSEDGLVFGDGFLCRRCGNYECVGLEHADPTEPGYPRRYPPGWVLARTGAEPVVFLVEAVFDVPERTGLLVSGRLQAGVITSGAILWTDDERPVEVISVEFGSEYAADRLTLLVHRSAQPVVPEMYLKASAREAS